MASDAGEPRAKRRKVAERLSLRMGDEQFSDVTFLVGLWSVETDGPVRTERLQRIPGHRLVLNDASPVFRAMLSGPLAEPGEVLVTDVEPDAFVIMLRYIYGDQLTLSDEYLVSTLYTAHKYELPELAEATVGRLIELIAVGNVLSLHEQTDRFAERRLQEAIERFVQAHAAALLTDDSFRQIHRSSLVFVLRQPLLQAADSELFDGCLRWARAACVRDGVASPAPEQMRQALGELIYLINLPAMKLTDFLDGPGQSGVLTDREQLELVRWIASNDDTRSEFIARFGHSSPRPPKSHGFAYPISERELGRKLEKEAISQFCECIFFESSLERHLTGFRVYSDRPALFSQFTVTVDGQVLFYEKEVPQTRRSRATGRFLLGQPLLVQAGRRYVLSLQVAWDHHRYVRPNASELNMVLFGADDDGQLQLTYGHESRFRSQAHISHLFFC